MEHPVLGVIPDSNESVNLDFTPATPPVEEVKDSTPPSSEEPKEADVQKEVPFGEHPRFKELIEEKNSYKQQIDELRGELDSFRQQIQPTKELPENNVPQEFVELFGTSDPKAYELFQKVAAGSISKDSLYETVDQRLTEKEKQQLEQEKELQKYKEQYDNTIGSLSEKHGFSKAQFRKWFAENPIYVASKSDEFGNPLEYDFDWERGAKLFASENPPKSRSSVAPPTAPNGDVAEKSQFGSLKDLANSTWGRL